jgi:parvulin-like peptidyl-prolyl cis-trans isomerase-like protein
MTTKTVAVLVLAGGLATSACGDFGQAMTAHTDVVARAGGRELKVDRTAALINSNPQIPAQPDVVMAVANLWVDYMLLGHAAAEDSTMHNVKLDALTEPMIEQDIVNQLHDKVIKPDTVIADDALHRLFDQRGAGAEVRARHILLSMPPDASPTQRDSVTRLAQQLRERAASGGDFAALAREHSGDPGSAANGGDLGFFPRDRMLKPFADAAFKLQPGEISSVVETPYGLHIIKVEERKNPSYEEQRDVFRQQVIAERKQDAAQKYFKDLTDPKKVAVQEGSYEIVKDLATKPATDLRGRAASRALVRYQGGSFTSDDYLQFVRRLQPPLRANIPQRSDEDLKNLLESLAKNKILIREAERQKLSMPKARVDTIKNGIYGELVNVTRQLGLLNIQPQSGESKEEAIERRVNALLEATIKGEQNTVPLGPLAYGLRDQFGGEIFERAVPGVVTKIEATRPAMPPQQGAPPPQTTPPPTPPDTSGRGR